MSFSKLINFIKDDGNESFLLVAHERPDGDTISSILAMGELLRFFGKRVETVSSEGVPEVFKYIPNSASVKSDFLLGDFDAVILLDNGDLKRTGFLERIILAKDRHLTIINIDHHPKNNIWKLAKINLVNEKASATCEIIYQLHLKMGVPVSPEIATTLLSGIYTDTGGFQHQNVSSKTLRVVSELLSHGAKLKIISENVSGQRSITMLKLWGLALSRIKKVAGLPLVYSIITKADIKNIGAKEADLAGVVNLIASTPDEQATILLYELPNGKIKGSLRTESSKIDVAKLAELFAGGGHRKAAGFVVEGKMICDGERWRIV
ncbi:MAG: phosphoesterase RecJ domain-containing protein [Candidatus Berkelbacteria bacterium Athens1014_28]|uniref:Phosphoesterase RecJ domain-containing protein n=1 Tax=Candidatus Berkelbacteria bacterium Athens1014_28 TaxID=2017145 RepID=A0A554LP03_9BACT|nr:MAG: phosphoesterase RecJ domain-containing protein [Candidatus Berkelbacteria bacterium Athens1014_28]